MAKTEKEIGNFYTEQSDPKKVKAQLAERINEKYGLENDATQDELSEAVEELLDFEKERVRVNEYEREEVEILASWVDRLRGPNVSRFFVLVKSNPDLHSLLSPGLNRKQRFARFKAEEGFVPTQEQALPALDSLKPLLSSILTNKRLSLLFFSSLRRDVKRESRIMKAEMKKKGASFETPFLAVGSGPQSAVVSSEALTKAFPLPKEFPQVGEEGSYRNSLKEFSKILLTIERQERCGGQFGQYGGDVFQLNSRNRPNRKDQKRLAGFGGNINTIGSIQPVDLPDVSGEAYPRQIDLGHVVEVDVKLNGPTSVEDQLTGITLVKKGKKDKLVATHGDLSEKRVAEMKSVHENIILTVGINEEKDVMSQRDENSRRIRGEARAKLAKGEDAGIYNTQEVFEKIGDPSSPEPLKEFQEEVIVVGGGDSAKVFLSKLFGYEGKTGIQNATANWPKKVTWIGVSEKTKNEWVKSQRVRYHELGLEFSRGDEYPKDKFPDFEYFNRIQTVEGKAVARVEGTIGGVKKFGYRVENNGQTSEYFAKAAVEATGFIDRTDELVLGIYQRDLKVSNFGNINSAIARVRDFNSDAAKNNLTEVLKNLGNFAEIEFEPQRARRRGSPEIGSVRKVRVINASDNCFTFRVAVEIFDAAGKKKYYTLDEIMALSLNERVNLFDNVIVANVKTGVPPVEAVYAEDDTSQESPIAVKYKDVVDQSGELRRVNVYKAGVAARLPLSEVERKSSPPAGKIKENSAALFFQTPRTEKLMRLLLNRYTREQVRVPLAQRFKSDLNAVDLRQDKLVNFSSPEDERPAPIELLFKPNGKKLKKNLPYDYVPNDILLDQVITSLDKYRFPVNYSNLQFRINRASGASTDNFEFTVSSGLPDTNQGKDLLRSLFGQPEMQRLIQDRFQYENIRSLSQRLSAKLNATFRDAEIKERIFSRTTEANIRGISAPPFDNPDVKKIVLEAFIDSRIGKKATNFLQGEEADQLFADILDDDEVRTLVLEELKQSENEALILTVGLHDLEQNAGERETKWPKVLDMRKITLNRVGGTPPVRNVRRKIGKSNA